MWIQGIIKEVEATDAARNTLNTAMQFKHPLRFYNRKYTV